MIIKARKKNGDSFGTQIIRIILMGHFYFIGLCKDQYLNTIKNLLWDGREINDIWNGN